uniref:ATP synthase subunit a n=1 Tax=Haematomyzus elephantis TaxID=160133 RepID=A0A0R5QQ70_9NEOP|nr:ATP synthase subunit 6 [Haematomyzus elephantis]
MICSLMSSFDPCSSVTGLMNLSEKWMFASSGIILSGSVFWLCPSGVHFFIGKLAKALTSLTQQDVFHFKSVALACCAIFINLCAINMVGLLPYSFPPSSHLTFNLALSLPLWAGGLMYSMSTSLKSFSSHFLPEGSPLPLSPFLVIVEIISSLIRPFSLSVRLMSNIMAGHMILTLMGQAAASSTFVVIPATLTQAAFIGFELGVSVVQAFVFMNLLYLYWLEADHN